jgi:thiamine pyrophosphokinase
MIPIIVLVGPFADSKRLSLWAHSEFKKNAAVAFVAVDAGVRPLMSSGLPVTLAIGDMDGLGWAEGWAEIDGVPVIQLPRAKERSDLAFALEFAITQKANLVYAFGFQGGRADHDLGVHLDLSTASRKIARVVSIGEKGAVFYVDARFSPLRLSKKAVTELRTIGAPKPRRKAEKNTVMSLFPIGAPASGVKLRGLRFPVLGGILSSSSQGLSNEVRAREIEIALRRGRVAVFFPA